MTSRSETRLKSLVTRRKNIDRDIERTVQEMRILERSWAEIADILGVTRQAAQQKYGWLG